MNLNNNQFIKNIPNIFTNNWTKESVKVIDEFKYDVYKDKNNSMITLIINNEINQTNLNWSQK